MPPLSKRRRTDDVQPSTAAESEASPSPTAQPSTSSTNAHKRTRTQSSSQPLTDLSAGSPSSSKPLGPGSTRSAGSSLHPPKPSSTSSRRSIARASPAPPSTAASSSAARPKFASSDSTGSVNGSEKVPTTVQAGDLIPLEGYRDVRVFSVHYDDVVACKGVSLLRGDQKVFMKMSLSARASAAQTFKQEAALLQRLFEAGINSSRLLAREATRYGTMLVTADEDLTFLAQEYLHTPRPTPRWSSRAALLKLLELSIKLVRALARVHKLGLVHSSLRSTTISYSVFGEVHLHDFSCAFQSSAAGGPSGPEGSQPIRERGMTEESLPYLAPECSGRVAKHADYRSDFYSVGATLFELLTGRTPFADALDPLELVHAHIARRPPLAHTLDESVPESLSKVLAKLLEKAPEERYQTAEGLVVDLELICAHLRAEEREMSLGEGEGSPIVAEGEEETFEAGRVDEQAYFKLPPPSKMFGRAQASADLIAAYERVKSSNEPEVVVIKGHSGIGKTSLVETVRKPVSAAQGHYTSVKFDQIKSPVPFFAITQALSGLLRQLLSESESQLKNWRRRLSRALGKEGRILADVLPSLEQLFEPGWLDALPAVPVLGPAEAEDRFQHLVQRVLHTFARKGKPLLVVFDDLQWSTPSDLAFIISLVSSAPPEKEVMEHQSPPLGRRASVSATIAPATAVKEREEPHDPILVICLWRDNEVSAQHIVSTQLLPALGPVKLQMKLEPLVLDDVVSFVSEAFRQPARTAAEVAPSLRHLAELILAKTLGSPLYVAQLLKILNQEGYFEYNFVAGQWEYDLDAISQAPSVVSTDVVQLLEARMRKFSVQTQAALKVAACLGNQELESAIFSFAAGRTPKELALDLREPVEEGLIVALGEASDDSHEMEAIALEVAEPAQKKKKKAAEPPLLRSTSETPVAQYYRFFHDRCQQAAYSLIPPSEVKQMHYAVGQRLVSHINEGALYDRIFDLVNQLNHGMDILNTVEERDQLASFNYLAGQKANKATAFEAARKYLTIAWDLLGVGGWVGQGELMAKVTETLVEVEFSLVDYAAAQEYVRIYLAQSKDKVGKMRVYARSIRCASAVGDSLKAIEIGREGLALAGVDLPDDTAQANALVQEIHDELALTPDKVARMSDLPPMTDPIVLGAQAIMAALVPPIYFTRIDLLDALSSLAAKCTTQFGLDDAGAFVFTLYAVISQAVFKEFEQALAFGRCAIGFVEKHGSSPLSCPTYKVYSSHVAVWSLPIREVLPFFHISVAFGIEYRDSEYVGFGAGELCAYSLLAGVSLIEVTANLERFSVLVRKFRHELSTLYIGAIHQIALNLVGRAADVGDIVGEACSPADHSTIVEKNYGIIIHVLHMGRLMLAIFFRDADKAAQSRAAGREHLAGGQGLLYPVFFQLFEAISLYDVYETLGEEEKALLKETMIFFEGLAPSQETNFRPLLLWLRAEELRVAGKVAEAVDAYDGAIESALKSEYIHYAACINERCARALRTTKLGAGYLIEARALWLQWGCLPKVSALEQEYPEVFPTVSGPSSLAQASAPPTPSVTNAPDPLSHYAPASATGVSVSGPGGSGSSFGGTNSGGAPLASTVDLHYAHPGGETETDRASSVLEPSTPSSQTWPLPGGPPGSQLRQPSNGSQNSGENPMGEHREGSISHSDVPSSRSHLATELDLRTVVSASSVISMELSIDGVVSKLLSLAMRTAGAELCLLVLEKGGTLCAEAIVTSESGEIKHLRRRDPVDVQPDKYPCSVINYVARSRAMVVNNLDVLGETISDPYLRKRRPKSVLCLALTVQQRVIGVLWMENSLTENAFTPDRLEILSLITGQAASTIEKARLVQDLKSANTDLKRSQTQLEGYNRNLEATVADRTLELRHKNDLLVAEIGEKERAQREMRMAKDVAESATAMKSQFLANMSHEIRTPFNAVVALAGLLLDTQLNPVQTDYVETIKNSSQELLVVINDILDYSKIELDHLELSRDKVQVRNMIESSLDMLAERAANKSVELALVLEQGDIDILGDLTRLRQIVVNLLSNAVKFTSHGEIVVTASAAPVREKTEDGKGQCQVTISVKDSGIGIARENFGKLFRVYSQAEGSETTKMFGGTGLGLAISRKLSLLMGGDITVDSEIGKGSTFTLSFLAPISEAPETDLYAVEQNPDLKGKRCLIVDSNETSRTVLIQLIKSFGIEGTAPLDVSAAYGMAVDANEAGKGFDVLIVDAFLPGFAAQVLLRRLRQKGINAPAIALTRMGSPIYEEMRQLDCKFLIKPIKRNRLHHTLRQVFPASEARRAITPPPAPQVFPTNLAAKQPLTILCAEDNPINVKVITHLLKRMGYSTEIAENGKVALEKCQRKRYDIIFMDVNMPVMGGLEATRRICAALPDRQIRPLIVAMTANAMAGDKESCLAAGCDGYVSKPILVPDLVGALNDAHAKANANRPQETEGPLITPATPQSAGSAGSGERTPTLGSLAGGGAFELELQLPVGRRLGRKGSASMRSASRGGSGTSSPARSPSPTQTPGGSSASSGGFPGLVVPPPIGGEKKGLGVEMERRSSLGATSPLSGGAGGGANGEGM